MKKGFRFYKREYRYYKDMCEHYKELYVVSVGELHFEKIQSDLLYGLLNETEDLLSSNTKHYLIKKVIGLGKEKYNVNKLIHIDHLFPTPQDYGLNSKEETTTMYN